MKDSLKKFMEEKMLPWGMKIGGEKHLVAIRDGLVTTFDYYRFHFCYFI